MLPQTPIFPYLHHLLPYHNYLKEVREAVAKVLIGNKKTWLLLLLFSLSLVRPHCTPIFTETPFSPKPNFQFPQNHQNLTSLVSDSLPPPLALPSLPVLSKAQSLLRYIHESSHILFLLIDVLLATTG